MAIYNLGCLIGEKMRKKIQEKHKYEGSVMPLYLSIAPYHCFTKFLPNHINHSQITNKFGAQQIAQMCEVANW